MATLNDFMQSMSNSAASNVSAPVDGINWLLRKAGLPVSEAPIMGSDWLAQRGFTRPVQQNAASLAGETAGMIAPMLAVAKAPQIAKGLLQGAENLAAPSALNKQSGAIVWHGSPHKFPPTAKNQLGDFDFSKIGTGEGAQAYGHGGYLADAKDVAKGYQAAVKDNGKITDINAELSRLAKVMSADEISYGKYRSDVGRSAKQQYEKMMDARGGVLSDPGYLYKVDLPDEHIAKMLDWDKPLSQQPHILDVLKNSKEQWASSFAQDLEHYPRFTGKNLVESATAASDLKAIGASDYFQKAGIPGIRYLDGGSRGAGAGSSNYVIFPKNEDLLTILERNGIPIK